MICYFNSPTLSSNQVFDVIEIVAILASGLIFTSLKSGGRASKRSAYSFCTCSYVKLICARADGHVTAHWRLDLLTSIVSFRRFFSISSPLLSPLCPGHLLRLNRAPGSRLCSALSVPPAGFCNSRNQNAGASNNALRLVWELGRSLFGCPRNKRAAEMENLHVHIEPAHDHRFHRQ